MSKTKSLKSTCINCNIIDHHQLRYSLKGFQLLTCNSCSNSFVNPVPKNMSKYYPENYWKVSGLLGNIKELIYSTSQSRRPAWIRSYLHKGSILDIGSGEALFAKKLPNFKLINIDFPNSKIKNPQVLKVDFLKWHTSQKFDAIVFWESLEHVPTPGKYLEKSSKLLKKNGLIFIECPNLHSLESKLFGKNWYHLDPPRHLSHFNPAGIKHILKINKFKPLSVSQIFTPEYSYTGLIMSSLNVLGLDPMNLNSHTKTTTTLFLLLSVLISPFALIIGSLLYFMGQSPIMLVVAKKI